MFYLFLFVNCSNMILLDFYPKILKQKENEERINQCLVYCLPLRTGQNNVLVDRVVFWPTKLTINISNP